MRRVLTLQTAGDLREKYDGLASLFWSLAAAIAFLLCFVQLGAMASLLAGRVGFAAVFPIAVLAAILAGALLQRKCGIAKARIWQTAGLVLLLLAVSLALSAFFFDLSWDGEWYHQTGSLSNCR